MALRKAPPHHVGHAERFDSQQVEDHRVGESKLGLEDGRFALSERIKPKEKGGLTGWSCQRLFFSSELL